MLKNPKIYRYFLTGILLLAFLLRLYKINNPVLDWHSWRQADTASVTREYVKHGIDLLHPTYHDLSNIPNYLDNSAHGYRMVEFPFINAFLALILRQFPQFDLAITSRLLSIFLSLGSLLCLTSLVKRLSGKKIALLTALIFAILPYNIYYSRVILPEPAVLFFSLSALLAFDHYLEKAQFLTAFLTILNLALALLLKPFVGFLAPVFLVLAYQRLGLKMLKQFSLYLIAIGSLLPFFLWRKWISQFPEGIPASNWLFNQNGIRFRPAWVRWLFYERLTKLFLGITGIAFLPFNFLKRQKDFAVYAAWWLGIITYFSVVATGNVQHDYYQVLAVPIVCISVARGIILSKKFLQKKLSNSLAIGIIVLLSGVALYLAGKQVYGYYNVNHWEYLKAGKIADQLLPADAKVIAPAMGDTMFLFQTNRTGWPIGFEIEDKIAKGATAYLTTSYDDEARQLETKYKTILKTEDLLLLDLTQPL